MEKYEKNFAETIKWELIFCNFLNVVLNDF